MVELVEGKEGATLVVSGDATVQNARELHDALLEWIGRSDTLNLNLSGVTDADLTFLQLLSSVNKSIRKMGKNLTATEEFPASVVIAAQQSGFTKLIRKP